MKGGGVGRGLGGRGRVVNQALMAKVEASSSSKETASVAMQL
eukprot:COSAG05_NODE_21995_length_268_cov_0.532544_1_plen_41_part_01